MLVFMMESYKQLLNKPDTGLLLLRLIVGGMLIAHGVGKFMGGPSAFEAIGENMAIFGISFGYVFWGFLAALFQTVGGFFVVIGFLFRLSCLLVLSTMIVAIASHLNAGDGVMGAAHAIKTAAVFLALALIGSGRYAVRAE